jgi:hypothetical protein
MDNANAVIRPPLAWALAFIAGVALDWLYPMTFVPTSVPTIWVGATIFTLGFALAIWAIITIRRAGSRVETNKPTTMIVTSGPYSFTRNPICIGMSASQTSAAFPTRSGCPPSPTGMSRFWRACLPNCAACVARTSVWTACLARRWPFPPRNICSADMVSA